MYNWLKWLTEQGHFVVVRVPISNMTPYEIDGIKVERDVYPETKKELLTSTSKRFSIEKKSSVLIPKNSTSRAITMKR